MERKGRYQKANEYCGLHGDHWDYINCPCGYKAEEERKDFLADLNWWLENYKESTGDNTGDPFMGQFKNWLNR